MINKSKVYFKNLNGLRFIAAAFVIVHHLEQFKSIFNLENLYESNAFVQVSGKLGVVLFFVLSGFLITYLLIEEEKTFKKISIKQFYIRRLLRIWPLYFLIIIIALFILPFIDIFDIPGYSNKLIFENLGAKVLLFVFFFPNLLLTFYGIVPYASQTWSIGTEEQFYLIWPHLVNRIKKYRLILMFAIIIIYMLIRFVLKHHLLGESEHLSGFYEFWKLFNIDCMAIGGIFAILLTKKNWMLKIVLNQFLFYITLLLILFLLYNGIYIAHIHNEFYSVLFGILIINFAVNEKIFFSLENKVFNFLGKISYGLYMFHAIAIVLTIKIGLLLNNTSNLILYSFSFTITIILAYISYEYFEKLFLKYKSKYSKIISGNDVNQ